MSTEVKKQPTRFQVVFKAGFRVVDTLTNEFASPVYSYLREACEEASLLTMRAKSDRTAKGETK